MMHIRQMNLRSWLRYKPGHYHAACLVDTDPTAARSVASWALDRRGPRRRGTLRTMPRRSSKGFSIWSLKSLVFLIIAVHGIWEDLTAWKTLLQCVSVICLQFLFFSKNTTTKNEKCQHYFSIVFLMVLGDADLGKPRGWEKGCWQISLSICI